MDLLIFVDQKKPRIVYTVKFVFRYVLGLNIIISTDKNGFCVSEGRKINYSNHQFPCQCLNIVPIPLLSEKSINKFDVKIENINNTPYVQFNQNELFDPLSCIFFCISRYEEYWDYNADLHGRFPAKASLVHKYDLTETPLVDIWIEGIRNELNKTFPSLPAIPKPPYRFLPTYDIDHVRAFLWKGWKRNLGATFRDVFQRKTHHLRHRFQVWLGKENDPYDTFGYLDELHSRYMLSPIYFWLIGDFGKYDKNPHHTNDHFRNQIDSIAKKYNIGIHPSYLSFLNQQQFLKEKKRLEDFSPIGISRFHFLRFKLSESYRMLIEAGIKSDYSMAFPDALGFRAGTSHSFLWFDLKQNKTTQLMVHPFQVMDVTLKNYMKMSPEMAIQKSEEIIKNIKKNGGCFTTLWHNSSFDEIEWEGWRSVYERILEMGQDGSMPNS